MAADPAPPTLSLLVHRAVEVTELGAPEPELDELLARFEDADETVGASEDVALTVDEALGRIDPDWEESGPLAMARSVVVYLAVRPEEIGAEPAELLRLAARAEFDGRPPPAVSEWLSGAGVEA
ncbi:MAG TPA: hypothetical protein VNV44_03610 [Solirubrobacteraceae bacterium]|jgi:hypothetical protein|nr:hypothetical protein [Solirubrobacteraceae bacterium]